MKAAVLHRLDQQLIVEDLPIFEPIPVDGFALHGRGETHVERQQSRLQDVSNVIEAISVGTARGARSVFRLEGDEQPFAEHHAMTTA